MFLDVRYSYHKEKKFNDLLDIPDKWKKKKKQNSELDHILRRAFNTLRATTFTIMSYVYSVCYSGNWKVKKKILNIVRTFLGLVHACQLQLHCLNLLLTCFGILDLASVLHDLSSGSSPTIYPSWMSQTSSSHIILLDDL